MLPRISIPSDDIAEFCRRWKIAELALFGSVLRDDFGPESDVDVLVTFESDSRWTLLSLSRMKTELGQLLGRGVDLVSRRGIERSRNQHRREQILSTAEVVYVAR